MTVLAGVLLLYVIIADKRINKKMYVLFGILLFAAYFISIIVALSQLLNTSFPTNSSYDTSNNVDTVFNGSKYMAYSNYVSGGLGSLSLLLHFFGRLY